ncbi:kinase-like protein [Auricularia subglabra TFB-10046 SS5]|nr:kinase-like protein [Auricularia subglabra TFB-10046 SS5]
MPGVHASNSTATTAPLVPPHDRNDLGLSTDLIIQGRYAFIRRLGSGINGQVWLATDLQSGTDVAVKAIPLKRCKGKWIIDFSTSTAHWTPEEFFLGRLNHVNIIYLTDCWIDTARNCAFMVTLPHGPSWSAWLDDAVRLPNIPTRKVKSRNLAQLIGSSHWRKDIMSEVTVRHIFFQIVLAVNHMFTNNVAHRELTPENILVDDDLHVRVADFGSAAILPPYARTRDQEGTSHYWPPGMWPSYPAPRPSKSNLFPPEKQNPDEIDEDTEIDFEEGALVDSGGHVTRKRRVYNPKVNNVLIAPETPPRWSEAGWDTCKIIISKCLADYLWDRPMIDELLHHPWLVQATQHEAFDKFAGLEFSYGRFMPFVSPITRDIRVLPRRQEWKIATG